MSGANFTPENIRDDDESRVTRAKSRNNFNYVALALNAVQAYFADALQEVRGTIIKPALRGGFAVNDIRYYGTLANAIAQIPSATSATVYITNTQTIAANLTVPSNISLIVLKGGSFAISTGVTLTFTYLDQLDAGEFQVFTGLGSVVGLKSVLPQWWGAVGDGVTDCQAGFQKATTCVSVSGGGIVAVPNGRYMLRSTVAVADNVMYLGRNRFTCVFTAPTGTSIADEIGNFFSIAAGVDGWAFRGLGFDNYSNYPNQDTVRSTEDKYLGNIFPKPRNTFVRASGGCANATISDCWFYGATGMSVRFSQTTAPAIYENIKIQDNQLDYGSYILNAIQVSGSNSAATRSRNIIVTGNILNRNSSQKYILPGIPLSNVSNDAIHLDTCEQIIVDDNVVNYAGAIGIRIEECFYGTVSNNTVYESGTHGINIYNTCGHISVIGNSILSWGRTPALDNMRLYTDGKYYFAKETAISGTVNLPADPSISLWFQENRWDLTGKDLSYVPDYNTGSYYTDAIDFKSLGESSPGALDGGDITIQANFNTPSNFGILPSRGCSGIAVNQASYNIVVLGNTIKGDLTQVGGKYTHDSSFGISSVHQHNFAISYASPMYCSGNIIDGVIDDWIYQPAYCDPVNARGAITGVLTYPGNFKIVGSNLVELPFVHAAMHVTGLTQLDGNVTVGDGTGAPQIRIDGAAANTRGYEIASNHLLRIYLFADQDTESGSDVGSTARFAVYDDAGAYIEDVFKSARALGSPFILPSRDLVMGLATARIRSNTADGSDTKNLQFCGGGDGSETRGSYLSVNGNEHASNPGVVSVIAGAVTGGEIRLKTGGANRVVITDSGYVIIPSETSITASTTQTQGQRPLTAHINIVSTVANANDTVTLPPALAGLLEVYIRNNGAQILQIFPASGDNINGTGVNASVTLAAGASVTYRTADTTNWYS